MLLKHIHNILVVHGYIALSVGKEFYIWANYYEYSFLYFQRGNFLQKTIFVGYEC